FERDLVGLYVKRRDQRRDHKLDEQSKRQDRRDEPALRPDRARGDQAGRNRQPLQGQRNLLIHVVDARHEAVVVPHHFIAAQKKAQSQREQENGRGAAQEPGLESALKTEDGRIDLAAAEVREPVPQLPAARRDPVGQDADDRQREQKSAQIGVEGQIEEI